ncbi:MAG: c-type cytochrome [Deltaproteobacteria bacterium]|nr:c-type cytochrome [Deltaproteobacteria bacterium]
MQWGLAFAGALAGAALPGCAADPAADATKAPNPHGFAGNGQLAASGGDHTAQPRGGGATNRAPVCTPHLATCNGLTATRVCATDGSAWQDTACAPGAACEDGQCRNLICQPGSRSCDGKTIVQCSARGVSRVHAGVCGASEACVGGQCVPFACQPGSTQCAGNVLATCAADGQGWQQEPCASDQACDVDVQSGKPACVPQVCAAGTATCKGGKVVLCDGKGLHEAVQADCAAKGQACLDGACAQYVCEPGQKGCDGVNVAHCAGVGTSWTITSCATGQACLEGACAAVTCVAGEVFCDGNSVAKCNATGTGHSAVTACSAKEICKQGACAVATVVCGDGLCDGDEPSSCAKDCKPVTMLSPDFDKLPAGSPTILPGAPRPSIKPALQPWLQGKPLKLHGNTLFLVDTDNGAVVVMDRLTLAVQATIAVGGRPETLVVDSKGTVYVASRDAGTVSRMPWAMAKPDAAWKVGLEPWGLAMSADEATLYVSLAGEDAIAALDPATGAEKQRAFTAARPKAIGMSPGGMVYSVHGDGKVSASTPASFMQKPYKLDAKAPTVDLRVANPVPACQDLVTKKVRVASRANCMAFEPETGSMLVPHVLVASGSAQDVLSSVGIKPPEAPQQFVVKCSGGYGSTCSKVPVPPPPGDPPCVGTPVRPYELTISKIGTNNTLQPTVSGGGSVLDVASGRNFLARFDQPLDVVYSPTASLVFVAAKGTNNVAVFNGAAPDPMQWPVADIKVGDGPKALAISGNGKLLYVLNAHAFTVSEVDLTPLVALADKAVAVEADPAKLPKMAPMLLKAGKTASYGKDPLSAEAQLGRKVFHYANNSRLSASNRFACATCHIDGTEDKQVWFVAEGPRQTPALAERLADTAPFNWLGSKYTLHDNIVSTTGRMGGSGLLPGELDGLVKFLIEGLKAPPNPHKKADGLTEQQLAGKKLFEDPATACTKCHVPGNLTDGAQHDVGTATSVEIQVAQANGKPTKILYNTPSLRGLWYSAPYLHDGSAATLKQALQKTASTMGKTSHLNDQQLDDLVAYLLTL